MDRFVVNSTPAGWLVTGTAGFIGMHVGEMAGRMRSKVVVEGRNFYQPNKLQSESWAYLFVVRAPI